MKTMIWVLIILAGVAFVIGALKAFCLPDLFPQEPVTYWRGAVGLLLFSISIRLMTR